MIFDSYSTSVLTVINDNLFDVPWLINGIVADMKLLLKELCGLGFVPKKKKKAWDLVHV